MRRSASSTPVPPPSPSRSSASARTAASHSAGSSSAGTADSRTLSPPNSSSSMPKRSSVARCCLRTSRWAGDSSSRIGVSSRWLSIRPAVSRSITCSNNTRSCATCWSMMATPSSSTAMMNVSRNCPSGIMGRISNCPWSLGPGVPCPWSSVLPPKGGSHEGSAPRTPGSGDQRLPTVAPARTPGIVIGVGSPGATCTGAN